MSNLTRSTKARNLELITPHGDLKLEFDADSLDFNFGVVRLITPHGDLKPAYQLQEDNTHCMVDQSHYPSWGFETGELCKRDNEFGCTLVLITPHGDLKPTRR